MKQAEVQEGRFYTSNYRYYRFVDRVEWDEREGRYIVHYRQVGCLPIRGKVHFMGPGKCFLESFAKWACRSFSSDIFINFLDKRSQA